MNKEQEFLNQIEEVLQAHEETYEFGAWEEFDANRKKNKRKWPIYAWAAAAVVLLFVSFGLFEIMNRNELQNDQLVVKNYKEQRPTLDLIIEKDSEKTLKTARTHKDKFVAAIESPAPPIIAQTEQSIVVEKPNLQSENIATSIAALGIEKSVAQKEKKYTPVLSGAYDSLMNKNKPNKFTYSLVVSPSISNQKMNFGAGMELSYKVGNRLSINSGLMYTAINAKSDGKSLVDNNSKSQGANLAVSGIELPLGIQYQTAGGFYAAAGVSAFGLIHDKLEYSFLEEKTITLTELSAGISHQVLRVVSEKKTEKSIEPLNNYMGFFNFSVGKKQAFGNVNLNIGPFVKVPFNSVSSEKIKLLQGGIKISIDF